MKLFVLTNHSVTAEQREDALLSLHAGEIIELPSALKLLWGEVPPDVDSVETCVRPFLEWLEKECSCDDVVWVQGEWGVTVSVLDWCRSRNIRCVYATTGRVATETAVGSEIKMTHVFKHVRFRDYPKIR